MRAGRLVAILKLLQARGRMTAGQIAAELEVSPRTIVRDIEALSGAGFPLYVTRGRDGGVELLEAGCANLGLPDRRQPKSATGYRVRVLLSPPGRRLAVVFGYSPAVQVRRTRRSTRRREGWVESTMGFDSLDDAVHDLLALGSEVEVVDPAELRAQLADAAARIADLYADA